jgi:hypothetical protein
MYIEYDTEIQWIQLNESGDGDGVITVREVIIFKHA